MNTENNKPEEEKGFFDKVIDSISGLWDDTKDKAEDLKEATGDKIDDLKAKVTAKKPAAAKKSNRS